MDLQLKYYALNEKFNSTEITSFNIFDNWKLNEAVIKDIKKYLRAPSKFKEFVNGEGYIYGWEAFVLSLCKNIRWQEYGRCEYEILVSSQFDKTGDSLRKVDCFEQCKPNLECIAREVIYQYKQWKKEQKK